MEEKAHEEALSRRRPLFRVHDILTAATTSTDQANPRIGSRHDSADYTERYKNHRSPGEIIRHGDWLYHRFPLNYCDVQ